jgi:hypothetical protein
MARAAAEERQTQSLRNPPYRSMIRPDTAVFLSRQRSEARPAMGGCRPSVFCALRIGDDLR